MLTRYRFRPGWPATLAFAVVLPVLLALGVWQLERASDKALIRDRYQTRERMEPLNVNRHPPDPAEAEFRRAEARGVYRPELTIYLDNKVLNGVPGYEVLTPLKIGDTGRFMLVNRGWVPWGESREKLPAVDTPGGVVRVTGRLRRPPRDYFTLESEPPTDELGPRWQNLDLQRYETVTGLPVSPLVLQLDPANTQGGGFVRQWPAYDDGWINRHRGYAVQWFALALTLTALYVVLNLEKRKPDE